MQKMMQQMQQAQACMAGVDQSELKKFEQRTNQMEASVKALCASGKRDEAQQEAIAFGREVASTPTMQKMQECGKMMQGAMPGMPAVKATISIFATSDILPTGICLSDVSVETS